MSKLVELAEKEITRNGILEVLEECGSDGASVELVTKCLTKAGIKCDTEEVRRECSYLKGKGLVEIEHVENKVLKISRDIIRITSAGMDVVDGTVILEGLGD